MRRVRLEGGSARETLRRPTEWSGKEKVRSVTVMEGASAAAAVVVVGSAIVVVEEWIPGAEERGKDFGSLARWLSGL